MAPDDFRGQSYGPAILALAKPRLTVAQHSYDPTYSPQQSKKSNPNCKTPADTHQLHHYGSVTSQHKLTKRAKQAINILQRLKCHDNITLATQHQSHDIKECCKEDRTILSLSEASRV